MKIALGQINTTIGDFRGNAANILSYARRAREAGAGLILFPELAVCGYPPRDLVERPSFVARNQEAVEEIKAQVQGITVICGVVAPAKAETGKRVLNSAVVIQDGRVVLTQSKMLLPTYDVFDESRNFAPAPSQHVLSFCGKQVALTICEDAWNDKSFWSRPLYKVDPVEALMREGGNFLLNISASFLLPLPMLEEAWGEGIPSIPRNYLTRAARELPLQNAPVTAKIPHFGCDFVDNIMLSSHLFG